MREPVRKPGDLRDTYGNPDRDDPFYGEHVKGPSRYWFLMRGVAALRAYGRCEACGRYLPARMSTAHLTHARLGHELVEDVAILCYPCHDRRDWMGGSRELPYRLPVWDPLHRYVDHMLEQGWGLYRPAPATPPEPEPEPEPEEPELTLGL